MEVPGWSTYIQPLGDRLQGIGKQCGRLACGRILIRRQGSIAARVVEPLPIGTHHSWSEANTDEKAFGWLEEAGLILVPFQAYEENQTTGRSVDRLTRRPTSQARPD